MIKRHKRVLFVKSIINEKHYYDMTLAFFRLILFDCIFTALSVSIGYGTELNQFVTLITPVGAYIGNLAIFRYFFRKGYSDMRFGVLTICLLPQIVVFTLHAINFGINFR